MDEPLFADKSHRPTDADLAKVLGPAKRPWDSFMAHVQEVNAGGTAEWKHYAGKSGWTFVVRDKRRNLAYVKPLAKRFLVSFAFSDEAVAAAEQSDLPEKVVKPIRESPKYPEGRAVRVEVSSAAAAAIARKLLGIKLAN
jgi:hypothetical protein